MLGGLTYSAAEGQELQCPHCEKWAQFQVTPYIEWAPVPWDRFPPDHGTPTENNPAWIEAVREINSLAPTLQGETP